MTETNKEKELQARFLDQGFPIKIGTDQYYASTLSDKDYTDYTGYIRARYLDLVEISSRNSPNFKERMALAQAELVNIYFFSKLGQDILWTEDGLLNLGFIMCRKKHPTLSFKRFKEGFDTDKETSINGITKAYELLNFTLGIDEGDVGGSPTESEKSDV